MLMKDTPPSSPYMEEEVDENDLIYVGDVDEVIEELERDDDNLDEKMDEDVPENDDATFVFKGHKTGSVFCGSLSKNGSIAVTGSEEDKAYVWNTANGEILLDCCGHKDSVIFVEFNFDETYVATGDMSGLIQVWKLSDKTLVWDYNMGDAIWMKWHMAANVLLAGSVDGEVYMWKLPDGDCKIIQGSGCRAEAGIIFIDGKRIAVGYEDGTIKVIDLKTTSVLSTILPSFGHSATITALDCHHDNNLIISAAVDGKTILSAAHTGKVICILQNLSADREDNSEMDDENAGSSIREVGGNWVETVSFCKDTNFPVAATGALNGEIFIWDISKKVLRHKIDQESGISKLCWKGYTSIFFSAGLDGILRCFEARSGQCVRTFEGHKADILDLYISDNGKRILTTSDDTTARIYEVEN